MIGRGFELGIFTVGDLAVRVIPLLASVAVHPHFAVDFAVEILAKVHLVTVVAFFIRLVARVAVLAEAHVRAAQVELHLRKLGPLVRVERCLVLTGQLCCRVFSVATRIDCALTYQSLVLLLGVVRAAKPVVARLLLLGFSLGAITYS